MIIKTLKMRANHKTRLKIGKEQYGCVGDYGKRNVIFLVGFHSERERKRQKDKYVHLIEKPKDAQ